MEHNNDIEEFSGGGRISPESSATDFPKGTLGVGKNGKVWINQPDKNGRLSWKPTENEFPISSIFSFGYWNEETFDFGINNGVNTLFYLRYSYEYENSYLKFTYPNGGADREVAGSLYELLDFFNDNFVAKTFDLLNTNPNINGELIQSEVRILFGRLRFLINNKGLRSPKNPQPTPEPKFKIGDKVKRLNGTQVMTVVQQIYDDKLKMFDYDLVFEDGNDVSLFENQLELYEAPEPKFKIGDKVVTKFGKQVMTVMGQIYDNDEKMFDYDLTFENGQDVSFFENQLELYEDKPEGKTPPKDCETDPNKIISGQVKKFYDLNKTRIEKLDSKFSCKIVQALVSLSEYESCGSPSSVTLPKAKSDLLSRISKLKI